MKKQLFGLLAVLCFGLMFGYAASAADPFTMGEIWVYKHEGARAMGNMNEPVNGDRVQEVVAIEGEGAEKRWLISEKWGDDENVPKSVVNAERFTNAVRINEDQAVQFTPAIPYDWMNLKPGEEKTVESAFAFGDNPTMPVKLIGKRLENETITVPAGEFKDCAKVTHTMEITFTPPDSSDKMQFTMEYTDWYHSSVNGFVKQTFTMKPPAMGDQTPPPMTGTSELKSHSIKKKEEAAAK